MGGLAEAAGGLVSKLRSKGVDVDVVLPDYGDRVEPGRRSNPSMCLGGPARCGPDRSHPAVGELTLLGSGRAAEAHPYVDASGEAWPDNELRFMQFSPRDRARRDATKPDVVHLNDYHTRGRVAMGAAPAPTVLTIHTLGYQGVAPAKWLQTHRAGADDFAWYGQSIPWPAASSRPIESSQSAPTTHERFFIEESGMGMHEAA